jgi:phosphoribosylformylglycinamidine synthase
LQSLLLDLARARKLASAHDVSDGGLAVALAECATMAPSSVTPVGARVDLELSADVKAASLEVASLLFGEHPTRVVVSVRPDNVAAVVEAAAKAGVGAWELGVTGGSSLSISVNRPRAKEGTALAVGAIVASLEELRAARERALEGIVGE